MYHKTNSFQGLFNIEFQFFHAAVGTLCARTAVMGAYLNVKINAGDLKDEAFNRTPPVIKLSHKVLNK